MEIKKYCDQISIDQFDSKKFIISKGNNYVLVENFKASFLLPILEEKNISLAYDKGIKQSYDISMQEYIEIVEGIIKEIDEVLNSSDYDYVSFRIKLISLNKLTFFLKKINLFFLPKLYFVWFPLLLFYCVGVLFFNYDTTVLKNRIQDFSFLGLYFPFIFISLLHEMGHVISSYSKKIEVRNAAIYFGFYSIFPVFFTDISHVWRLSKVKRIIANLGGVSIEILLLSLLLTYYLFHPSQQILLIATSWFFITMYQLIPFIRSDGYWILCDLFNQPNLQRKFIAWGRGKRKFSKENLFIITYGFINALVFSIAIFFYVKNLNLINSLEIIKNIFLYIIGSGTEGLAINFLEIYNLLYTIALSYMVIKILFYFIRYLRKKLKI